MSRILMFLVLFPKTPRFFLDFFDDFEKTCKIQRTMPSIISKIWARNVKNPRYFLASYPRLFLVLLPRSWFFWFCCLKFQEKSLIFFRDFEKFIKILRYLPRIKAKILARSLKNPKLFLARNRIFSVLLQRYWRLLIFLPRNPKKFMYFFPRSLKILQKFVNAVEKFCQDPGKKCQKSKIFLGKKSKSFLGSLAKILDFFFGSVD